jgi:acetate kinase
VVVLALNCGSSSLKFQAFASDPSSAAGAQRLAQGLVERIGSQTTLAFQIDAGVGLRQHEPIPDHAAAVRRVLAWLTESRALGPDAAGRIDGVGHRVVHGGERFTQPVLADT